jgi:hypothetical protein
MDDVFDELVAQVLPPIDPSGQLMQQAPFHNVTLLFEHVAAHAEFYRVMLGKDGAMAFIVRVRALVEEIIRRRIEVVLETLAPGTGPRVPPEIVSSAAASTLLGVITWWLENGQPYPPAQMADYAIMLTVLGSYQALSLKPIA